MLHDLIPAPHFHVSEFTVVDARSKLVTNSWVMNLHTKSFVCWRKLQMFISELSLKERCCHSSCLLQWLSETSHQQCSSYRSLVSRSLESSTNHQQLSVPMSQSWKLRRTKLPREEWWVPPVISKDPRALAKSGCSTSVSWEQAINNGAIITGYMLEMAQVCVRVSRASERESED